MSRTLLIVLAAVVAVALGGGVWLMRGTSDDAPRPARNVILIVADDLAFGDLSAYPNARLRTPAIEAMAARGVLFELAYTAASTSGPARAGLLTGRHPSRFGYEYDNGPPGRDLDEGLGLPTSEVTLASALKDAGFVTAGFGRWQLGMRPDMQPTRRGFDQWVGNLSGPTPYQSPASPDVVTEPSDDFPVPVERGINNAVVEGSDARVVHNEQRYLTTDLAERAVRFIEKNHDKRFFLYLAFNAPHTPLQAPRNLHEAFAAIEDPKLRTYAAMVRALDDAVGQIRRTLAARGLDKDTLIIFTADSGCNPLSGACSCKGVRGGETSLYEGGLRVPLVMEWPRGLPVGVPFPDMVSTLDIYATVLGATGARRPPGVRFDGVDLLRFLDPANAEKPHDKLIWLRRPLAAFRSGDFKLIDNPEAGNTELYNLAADPHEKRDLSQTNPDLVRDLRTQMTLARGFAGGPLWQPRAQETLAMCGETYSLYP